MKRKSFIIAIICGVLQAVFSLGVVWIIKEFVDISGDEMFQNKYEYAVVISLVYLVLYVTAYFLSRISLIHSMAELRTNLKRRIFEAFLWEKTSGAQQDNSGSIVNRFEQQVDTVENMYYTSIYNIVKNTVLVLIALFVAFRTQWIIALSGIILLVLYFPLTKKISLSLSRLQEDIIQKNSAENIQLSNLIEGYHLARDMDAAAFFETKYENATSEYAVGFKKMNVGYYYLTLFKNGIEPLLVLVMLCVGVILMSGSQSAITLGTVLAMTQLIPTLISPVAVLGEGISKIASTRKIKDGIETYIENGTENKSDWVQAKENISEFERIELKNVTFSYGERTILQDVSMTFEKGKKYAVIGDSGSGKSTLLKLLTKQVEPDNGAVYLNGMQYSSLNRADIIDKLSFASQNVIMFDKNIKDNIILDREFNQEKYDAIISRCKLMKLKDNFETRSAGTLSLGEKKRVALARALYREKQLLILDEFTSALDEENALELETMILRRPELTVINVTHRLSEERFSLYDYVYRLENKSLVRVGV